MSNYWEEWDFFPENYEKHVSNTKELKQLEERKLMEKADNQLTRQLFENEKEFIINQYEKKVINNTTKVYKNDKDNNKKKKQIMENRINIQPKTKLIELFEGNNLPNEYDKLENKY